MPTIKDIAKIANVSVATVSFVLNGKADERKISQKTQSLILSIVKELNYVPNVSAKKLRNASFKEYTVGIYWATDLRTSFLARLIWGIQSQIKNYPFPVHIVICPYASDDLEKEINRKGQNFFNAAIIANTSQKDMQFLENFDLGIPVVLYNRNSENYNTVTIDNFAAGQKAAELLIKNEFTEIGIIKSKDKYLATNERTEGFLNTLIYNNIKINKASIWETENSILGGAEIGEMISKQKKYPQAIFCETDLLAQGFLYTMRLNNIKVPDEIAVIAMGMGNPETNKYTAPPLTVVEVPIEKMAIESIRLVIDILENNPKDLIHKICDTELFVRGSCY